jgi:hypothetical protein
MTDIDDLTAELRTDPRSFYERLRELLAAHGVEPHNAWLVELFSDDASFEFGIVVAGDRRVFQFGYDYLHRDAGAGEFAEWVDLTASWPDSEYRVQIESILGPLDQPPNVRGTRRAID